MPALVVVLAFLLGFALALALVAHEARRAASALEQRVPGSSEKLASYLPFRFTRKLTATVNACLEGERALARKERARSSDLLRTLSDLSHDIRTPLAAAKGHLQLIELGPGADMSSKTSGGNGAGRSAGEKPADASAHLAAALARIGATTQILDQMLDLARSSDPDTAYDLAPTPLLPALITVLENHEAELLPLEPEVSFEDESVCVEADAAALGRILENLITNAIRYGRPGIRCSEQEADGGVLLALSNEVADPQAIDTSLLFERFYRADPSRSGTGTGLGLAIARALARGMGMDLSARVQGSTITFTLRMTPTAAPARHMGAAPNAAQPT